ncbi:MAG: Holliday junction resolvase RuvX [Gemmatimonadota bacterium]|nr:Holliday junction resolvase RuvX [Gemmatimonadota bacterium]MDH5197843.1 Holliday junction resolvase RuvX [Gemmatimonadota bacterium]
MMTTGRPPAFPPEGRLLAVDWGEKRIGLAVTDPTRTIAQPLATLTRRAGRRFPMQSLRAYLEEYRPVGIVVGLPLTPEGAEGPAAQAARAVAELIAEKTGLPVILMDERMTTARAAEADAVGGRVDRDQRAASILLQGYLERERP